MDKTKINFNNITSINCSYKSQYHHNAEDNYTNDNILLFGDSDDEIEKEEIKKNNKLEFERILYQTKQKFLLLSEKTEQIINNKNFSLKKILANNLNIQAISQDDKKNNNPIKNINSNGNNNTNINKNENNNNYMDNNNFNKIILSPSNNNYMNLKMKNHFKVVEPFNSNNNKSNILIDTSDDIESPNLIGKKRKQQKNNNTIEKIINDTQVIFNEILLICQAFSNIKNDIIRKEEQNILNNDNEDLETTIFIKNKQIATIYLNNNIINKIYVFKSKQYLINENEILSQLKIIKRSMNTIVNNLRKNNNMK
jgi:hypothetical protein